MLFQVLANQLELLFFLRPLHLLERLQFLLHALLLLLIAKHFRVFDALVEFADALCLRRSVFASHLDLLDQSCDEQTGPEATTMLVLHLDLSFEGLVV